MRHNSCPNDTNREQDAARVALPRNYRMEANLTPIGVGEKGFDHIANANYTDQYRDNRFERTKAVAFQEQNQIRHYPRNQRGVEQGNAKEQVQANTCSQELSQVCRHSPYLRD